MPASLLRFLPSTSAMALALLAGAGAAPAHGGAYTGPGEPVPPGAVAVTPGGPPPVLPPLDPFSPSAELLGRIRDRGLTTAERMAALEELALRDEPLPFEPVAGIRFLVKSAWMPEYARVLARTGPSALKQLHNLRHYRDPRVQAEAVYGIVLHDEEGGEAFARELVRKPNTSIEAQVAALRALAERSSAFARPEAYRMLRDGSGAAFQEALATLRIDPREEDWRYLIQALEEREGLAAREALRELHDRTGYGVGPDASAWMRLYRLHQVKRTPFRAPSREESAQTATVSTFGVPLSGERVVFLLDTSGSMTGTLAESEITRGERAVKEIEEALLRMPSSAFFEVVFFGPQASALFESLRPRQPPRVDEAKQAMASLTFRGATDLHAALELAFGTDGVEELLIVTDGVPSAGRVQEPQALLRWVGKWNRWRNARVNTVSVSAPLEARPFLATLATQHRGMFRSIE